MLRGADADVDRLRTLMRESRYAQALSLLASIVPARYARLAPAERAEVVAAAQLVAGTLLEKPGHAAPLPHAAQALVFDARLQRSLGPLPPGTSSGLASHGGQNGFGTTLRGSSDGAFSYHLVDALRDAAADADRGGCSAWAHLPALAGNVAGRALFEADRRPGSPRPQGRLLAALVGMARFRAATGWRARRTTWRAGASCTARSSAARRVRCRCTRSSTSRPRWCGSAS